MAFTIPNQGDAGNSLQAEPDSVDIDILVAAYSGSGVVSGCAVTAQGTPDLTVAVASGTVIVAGVRAAVTGANATIGTADTSNPRFDLITVNSSGTIATTAGTAAAIPAFPAIPSNSVVLAAVLVPASDTAIQTAEITDKRAILLNGCAAGPGDDVIFRLGDDGDIALLNRSTSLSATTTLTNVVEGTAATLATAANSLIISNITDDGDIHLIVSKGGNSHTAFLADGSTGDTYVNAATGQVINLAIAATAEVAISGAAVYPVTDDGQTLGILNTNEWSDFYLASGGVIGWNNNDVTLTHTANVLTLGGGSLVATLGAITLAGAVTGGDQAFTAVGDMTFTAASIIAAGSTNADTLLFKAGGLSGTTFITLTSNATDVCTMDAITASGTWLASGTWTLPALTLGGTIAGGDQSWTGVGDMTFTAGSILKSGGTNTDTLILAANDTTFITLTTAATDTITFAGTVISGQTALAISPAGTDELLINDGGTIKKITADDFMFGDASTPSTQAHSDSAATGSAIEAARIDHKHAMPAAGGGTEATQSDMEDEGTSNADRFVSPEVAKFAPSAAKFWLDLDGDAATATIAASYNVSSVTDSTTGTFVVNLSTAFSSTRWACVMGSSKASGGNTGTVPLVNENKGSNTATILVRDNDDDTALIDAPEIYFAGFGDQA